MPSLSLVSIVVEHYDPAIAFFVDVLGFDLLDDSPVLTHEGRPKRLPAPMADLELPVTVELPRHEKLVTKVVRKVELEWTLYATLVHASAGPVRFSGLSGVSQRALRPCRSARRWPGHLRIHMARSLT